MGKNSAGHMVRRLRGLFRPKAKPIPRSPSPLAAPAPAPLVSNPSPAASVPQTPPDPRKKNRSGQETKRDQPHDRALLDEEVKASIDAMEKMLLAMHNMSLLTPLMSGSSSELSEAMTEYGRVFQKRSRADPDSSVDQTEDNARFRCYSHASKFWDEMSTMQTAVHETLVKDYEYLNRQVANFFKLHSSDNVDDRKVIEEYDKMLDRVEKVAGFRFPPGLECFSGRVQEDARRKPEYRKHLRTRPGRIRLPHRVYPVSGFAHGREPPSLESPAMYPGAFRPHWGELDVKASQLLREASSGDKRFETLLEMRDNLMMSFAKKHNDALRGLETDFLARVAVGLTNTGFDRLKDAYRKADEWASVVGLQTYAEHLRIGGAQAEVYESLVSNPPGPGPMSALELMADEWNPNYQRGFGVDYSADIAANSDLGKNLSPGPFPESFIGERAEDGDNESDSESDDPGSDDSTGPRGFEPGPGPPGGNNPRPPGGNSGSNFAGGPSTGGYSNNSAGGAGGAGGSRNSASSNCLPSYTGSGSSYEGNRRFAEGLQAGLSGQIIYESSDNESPSMGSDSSSGSNRDSVLSRSSLSTTQTSLGSADDLSKSPKGSSPGRYALTIAQPVPGVGVTPVSPEADPAKKSGNRKLCGTTFGITEMPMGSKTVEGSGGAQAQDAFVCPFDNPFEDTPMALSTLVEDSDEDPADDHRATRTGRKHRHLRRVPRFLILQGGKLKVFGRYNSYAGTGLKTKSPARGLHPLKGYQRLSSSMSLPILSTCDAVPKSAGPLSCPGGNDSTTSGPASGLFYKNAGGQATGTIPQ
ncbi:unnamed protein product [Tuber aestivum]|uniref:Uncharacterized protein n=1 Tax=Tuber aestivum TaxID=59557 RepID=A0A292PY68_9PEZI|nr:unnamed protein product [Tuber aestivum]